MIYCTKFHGDDAMTSTPHLIMQYKPYIAEQSSMGHHIDHIVYNYVEKDSRHMTSYCTLLNFTTFYEHMSFHNRQTVDYVNACK